MEAQSPSQPSARGETRRKQLLFWMAVALAPEAAPWFWGGYSPFVRHDESSAATTAPQAINEAIPLDEPRQAA